jgi:hypothetical protein
LFEHAVEECLELLSREDHHIKDDKLSLLRGIILTLVYIETIAPGHVKNARVLLGRVALLANSKLAGNWLVYSLAMAVFGNLQEDETILLHGNCIQKARYGFRS